MKQKKVLLAKERKVSGNRRPMLFVATLFLKIMLGAGIVTTLAVACTEQIASRQEICRTGSDSIACSRNAAPAGIQRDQFLPSGKE